MRKLVLYSDQVPPQGEKLDRALLACDAIHLSGGDILRFLHGLRMRGMIPVLREYVAGGGVLVGVSAGAILMTPDIGTAAWSTAPPALRAMWRSSSPSAALTTAHESGYHRRQHALQGTTNHENAESLCGWNSYHSRSRGVPCHE